MSCMDLTDSFFKNEFGEQIGSISKNCLCENIVTKIFIFKKIQSNGSFLNLWALVMHLSGLYFINQENLDYFPKDA